MRGKYVLMGLALGLLGAGCGLVENGAHITTWKVRETLNDYAEQRRNRRWAEQAWEQVGRTESDGRRSSDYADGFKDGFSDYLYEGGDGEPPPLPPVRYRTLRYQTPQGCQAIEDWFDGFRRGAGEARQGGYREWVTGPSSLRCAAPAPPLLPVLPAPVVEELPPPRPAPAKEDKHGAAPPAVTATLASAAPAKQDKHCAAPTKEDKHAAAQVAPAAIQTAYHPDPTPPPAPRAEKRPSAPAAPVRVWARWRRESNKWVIAWGRLEGGVGTTTMSQQAFRELVERLEREGRENTEGHGRNAFAFDDGTGARRLEIDDESFDGLVAYLKWYYDDGGQ